MTCTFFLGQSGKLLGCQQILHKRAIIGQLWSHCQSSLWTQLSLLHSQTLTNGNEAVTSLLGHFTHLHTPIPPPGVPFSCLEHPSHEMNVRFLLGALDLSDFCLGAFSPGPELLSHKKSPNISVPCLMPLVYISYYFRHRAQRSIFDKRQGCGC